MNLRGFSKVTVIAAVAILALGITPADAARSKKKVLRKAPDRYAEIVVEASTGYVLSEKNADKKLYPASLTKMMTMYLTFQALEQGKLSKNERVYVSKRAAAQEPSSLGLRPGDTIRIQDAILAIATKSANDCAVVLAEAVGGSEERFARLMTLKARQLGMKNTTFINASGLFKPGQVSTARDMSILSRALIRDYPKYYSYFNTSSFTYAGNTYRNHNKLMSSYRGMDGLKTGYVYASGYNLAASAVRNGTRLVGVVFGGQTARSRNSTMAQLLDRGFADVSGVRVASLAQKAPKPKPAPVVAVKRHPEIIPAVAEVLAEETEVTAAGIEQGDTSEETPAQKKFAADFRPRPLNTTPVSAYQKIEPAARETANDGSKWAIQIGAFSSHSAGSKALQFAKKNLRGMVGGVESIAPLMTSRGMIYRARLAGLGRTDAAHACQILKGNCLILSTD